MSENTQEATTESQGPFAKLLSSIKFLVDPVLPVDDRRISNRLDCSYQVHYLTDDNKHGQGELLDISRRGLRLRTDRQLAKGRTIALKSPKSLENEKVFPPVMARIVWACRETGGKFLAGLLLPTANINDETWVEELLTRLGYADDGQRRRHVRAEANLEGVWHLVGGAEAEVLVLNLGLGGALIRAEDCYEKDSAFTLQLGPIGDLPEVELQGTVIKNAPGDGDDQEFTYHSVRFRPLEKRRHALLKEYIIALLQDPEEA